MDLVYLKDHITEELNDSKDYIKRAIEIRPMNANWGKILFDMSAQELTHASYFYNMFNEYCVILSKNYVEMPDYISKIRDEVVDMYTECSVKIKAMHEMYAK